MNVASGQLDAHFAAEMSPQLVLFRHRAQVSSGAPQLASHEKPDELMLHETSLSHASLQLELVPHPATPRTTIARAPIHQRFT